MGTDEPKLTIFVSSMINPLWDERAAVEEAIRTGIPLARTWVFERAPASSEEITESYLACVRECDIYLLILGEDISDPVEAEYQTARERGKPRLCFVQKGVERTLALEEFLPALQADVKYATFSDETTLQREVLRAVRQELVRGYKAYHLQAAERLQVARDIEVPPGIRQELMRTTYLDKIADDCRYVEPKDLKISLTEVFVMLQAVERRREEPLREDFAPLEEREREAGFFDRLLLYRKPREAEKAMMISERPAPSPPPPPVELSKALQEHNHLVLLGEPGVGKTTTLQYIALLLAEGRGEELGLDGDLIPVRLDLRERGKGLSERRLDEFLKDCLHKLYIPLELADVWLEEGRLILLFDGLDEVWPEERQRKVLEAIGNFSLSPEGERTHLVLSSRLPAYRATTGIGGDFGHYVVYPFTKPEETLPYAAKWFVALGKIPTEEAEGRAQELLGDMQKQPGLRRVISNPLLLRLAIEVYLREGEIVSSRAELYKRYMEETRKRARVREDPSVWKVDIQTEQEEREALETALETIAWKIFVEREYGKEVLCRAVEEKLVVNGHKRVDGTKLAEYLRQAMGLLILYQGERKEELFLFSHFSFCEYFVAFHLARCWWEDEKRTWHFLKSRLHHPAWREPILLLAGLLREKEGTKLVRRVLRAHNPYERFLHRDLFLAAALIGHGAKVGEETAQEIGHRIVPLLRKRNLREQVTESLVEMGNLAIPHLIVALPDEHRDWLGNYVPVREAAAKALGELKAQEAVPHLVAALGDERWPVREAAAEALGELKAQEAAPHLIAALRDSEWLVREAAAHALGKLKAQEAIPRLMAAFRDKSIFVRRAADKALGEMGKEAMPYLIAALVDEDWRVRQAAAYVLGKLKSAEAVPHLITALRDRYMHVRLAAAEALGEIGSTEAVPHLIAALEDERWSVRVVVAYALGEMKAQEAVPHLIVVMQDERWPVRDAAAYALGKLGAQEAVLHMIVALEDRRWRVRQAAAKALAEIKAQEAVPYLIAVLEDNRWPVREAAAKALGELKAQQAIPHLIAALRDVNVLVRETTAKALGELKAQQAIPHLIVALRDRFGEVQEAAAKALGELKAQEAVPYLIAAMGVVGFMQVVATEALREIGSTETVPRLITALGDKRWPVRNAAANALGELKAQEAVPHLIAALGDENSSVRDAVAKALGKIGKEAVPHMIAALKDSGWRGREVAAEALGDMKAQEAIPHLIVALGDESLFVRWAAAKALGELAKEIDLSQARNVVPVFAWGPLLLKPLRLLPIWIFLLALRPLICAIRSILGYAWASKPLKEVVSRITELEVVALPSEDPYVVPKRSR